MLITQNALTWDLMPNTPPQGANLDQWAAAKAGAVEWLWSQTARRFGTRAAAYRPQALYLDRSDYLGVLPYLQDVYGPLWGSCQSSDWARQYVLQLPGPAVSVQAVTLFDGLGLPTLLDPSAYRLDGDYLVRVDGTGWPPGQDLIANVGSANTWEVEYTRGVPVPIAGQIAAAQLAAEWLKMINGDKTACKIPWNATSAARSGVTVQLQATLAYRTSGIALVDRWVTSMNPAGLVQPPRVWSPDIDRNSDPYRGSGAPYMKPTTALSAAEADALEGIAQKFDQVDSTVAALEETVMSFTPLINDPTKISGAPIVIASSTTSAAMTAGRQHLITGSAAQPVTAPTSPVDGATFSIKVADGSTATVTLPTALQVSGVTGMVAGQDFDWFWSAANSTWSIE